MCVLHLSGYSASIVVKQVYAQPKRTAQTQDPSRDAADIRVVDQQQSIRFHQTVGKRQQVMGLGDMFDYVPQGDHVETLVAKHTGLQNAIADVDIVGPPAELRHPPAWLHAHSIEPGVARRHQECPSCTAYVEQPPFPTVRFAPTP